MVSRFVLWYILTYFASTSVSFTQAVECQGTAKYKLTFKAEWTAQSHGDFPTGSDHFSSLVGCSHKASYVMWKPEIIATPGVKSVAETGSTTTLWNEMQAEINSKDAFKRYRGSGISSGTGTASISDIEVNTEYSLVSFITMIAPSPDWFVGVHDWQLCDTSTGRWKDSSARDLPPYDSGTDSGPNFRSDNNKTDPPVNIHLITNEIEGSLKSDQPIPRFGTFTFEKTFDSNPNIQPSSTASSAMAQTQTPYQTSAMITSVNIKSASAMQDPKKSSTVLTQQVKSATKSIPGILTETLTPTATITNTASVHVTPTFTTTSAACSVEQLGFILLLLAMILANLCF